MFNRRHVKLAHSVVTSLHSSCAVVLIQLSRSFTRASDRIQFSQSFVRGFFILITVLTGIVPIVSLAQTGGGVGLLQGNLWYSRSPFYAGETVTVFTAIWNGGPNRVRGKVAFLDNGVEVGRQGFEAGLESLQEVSIRWIPSEGTHKLVARIVESFELKDGKYNAVVLKDKEAAGGSLKVAIDPTKVDTDKDGIPDVKDPEPLVPKKEEVKVDVPGDKIASTTSLVASSSTVPKFDNAVLQTASNAVLKTDSTLQRIAKSSKGYVDFQMATIKKEIDSRAQEALKPENLKKLEKARAAGGLSSMAAVFAAKQPLAYLAYYLLGVLSFVLGNKYVLYILLSIMLYYFVRYVKRKREERQYYSY